MNTKGGAERIQKEVVRFLKKNFIAALATVHRELPYISTIYYVLNGQLSFYFITTKNTDKYLNLSENDNVALVIGAGPKLISVQARGHAQTIRGKEKDHALEFLHAMYTKKKLDMLPFKELKRLQSKNGGNNTVVFKIVPRQMTFMNLDDADYPASLGTEFHSILPC